MPSEHAKKRAAKKKEMAKKKDGKREDSIAATLDKIANGAPEVEEEKNY